MEYKENSSKKIELFCTFESSPSIPQDENLKVYLEGFSNKHKSNGEMTPQDTPRQYKTVTTVNSQSLRSLGNLEPALSI